MMKLLPLIALVVGSLTVTSVFAGTAENKSHPCKKIVAACQSAGFVKGGHKNNNKGLWKDCFQPVLGGQTVSGVTVDASDIQACQAKKAARK